MRIALQRVLLEKVYGKVGNGIVEGIFSDALHWSWVGIG